MDGKGENASDGALRCSIRKQDNRSVIRALCLSRYINLTKPTGMTLFPLQIAEKQTNAVVVFSIFTLREQFNQTIIDCVSV